MTSKSWFSGSDPAFRGGENSLCQHDLERVQRDLLLMHVTNVHQQVGEEDSVHHLIDIVRVRPDQQDGIFRALWHGVKAMRYPWLDLMRSIFSGIDRRGCRPPFNGGYLALEDLESLRLIEMEVEGRCLNFSSVDVTWKRDGISI